MAGGLGTRLRPLTYDYPKPLMPVDGRPSIFYLLNSLSGSSDEFIITSNYLYEKLLYELTHNDIFNNFNFVFSIEKSPLGTFGGVKKIESFIDSTFIIGNADTIFDFPVKEIIDFHLRSKNLITIALTQVEDPSEYGVVKLDNGRIVEFQEKPKINPISNIANTGLYIMEPEVFDYFPKGKVVDIAKDLIPKVREDNKKIGGFLTQGAWIDIGKPRDLIRANVYIAEKWGAKVIPGGEHSFYNGNINYDASSKLVSSYIYDGVTIGKNCRIENSLILNNSILGDECTIINSIIGFNSEILKGSKINNSVLGSKVVFGGTLENSINSRKLEDI